MEQRADHRIQVECQECSFAEVVGEDDERLPGEVVIQHGRSTGHKLRVEYPEV